MSLVGLIHKSEFSNYFFFLFLNANVNTLVQLKSLHKPCYCIKITLTEIILFLILKEPTVKRMQVEAEETNKMDIDEQPQQDNVIEPTVSETAQNKESVVQEKTVEIPEQPVKASVVAPVVPPTRGHVGRGVRRVLKF